MSNQIKHHECDLSNIDLNFDPLFSFFYFFT